MQGGGKYDESHPIRGASCSSNGSTHLVVGAGQGSQEQGGRWRNNNQEMEDFEMEMDD